MNIDTNKQLLRESENYAEAMRLIQEIKSLESQIEAARKAFDNTGEAGALALIDYNDAQESAYWNDLI